MKKIVNTGKISDTHSNRKTGFSLKFFLLFLMLVIITADVTGFQDETYQTRLSLSCIQMPERQVAIEARLRARVEGQYVGLPKVEVTFFSEGDSSVYLGIATTDDKGIARIMSSRDQLVRGDDNFYTVKANFEGNERYDESDNDLSFKPAVFEMNAEEVDSVKTITVKVYEDTEEMPPLADAEVFLLVPRMFSDLTIGTEFTDDDGMAEFVFPNDLPGGQGGELSIKARIDETDEHASLANQVDVTWGVPIAVAIADKHKERALWTSHPPLWMVITFAILMTLVWGHYFIIIFKLYLVKREASRSSGI